MTRDEAKEMMVRWFEEVWNQRNFAYVEKYLAADAIARGQGEADAVVHGPAGFKPFFDRIHGAFSDIRITVEDAIAEGDRVAIRWSGEMTHSGDDLGIRATGRRVHISGTTTVRIWNGQIVEGWDNWDQYGLMQQLGGVSTPAKFLAA